MYLRCYILLVCDWFLIWISATELFSQFSYTKFVKNILLKQLHFELMLQKKTKKKISLRLEAFFRKVALKISKTKLPNFHTHAICTPHRIAL